MKTTGRIITSFVVASIIASMLVWGLKDTFSSKPSYIAKIGNDEITFSYFYDYRDKMHNRLGKKSMTTDQAKEFDFRVLQELVIDKILDLEMVDIGFYPSDKVVAETILQDKQFVRDGKFNKSLYANFLINYGITEQEYLQIGRRNIFREYLNFITDINDKSVAKIAEEIAKSRKQQRVVDLITVPVSLASKVNIKLNDEELQRFFDENRNIFTVPAAIEISYIDSNSILSAHSVEVTDKEIREYYNKIEQTGGVRKDFNTMYFTDYKKAQEALHLLKKKPFLEVTKQLGFKKEDTTMLGIGYTDLVPTAAREIFSLPKNQISNIVALGSDKYAILQNINESIYGIQGKKQGMEYLKQKLINNKKSHIALKWRDRIRDHLSAGETLTSLIEKEAVGAKKTIINEKLMVNNLPIKDELLLEASQKIFSSLSTAQGFDIIEKGDGRFLAYEIIRKEPSRNLTYQEAKKEVEKSLHQQKNKEFLKEIADSTYENLLTSNLSKAEVVKGIVEGRGLLMTRQIAFMRDEIVNDTKIPAQLLDNIFVINANEVTAVVPNEQNGSYMMAILREIRNNKNAVTSAYIKEVVDDFKKQKRIDLREIYYQYLYNKYKVKINYS